MIAFKAPEGISQVAMAGMGGHVQILDADKKLIIDSRVNGKKVTSLDDPNSKWFGRRDNYVDVSLEQGKVYWLYPDSMYLAMREKFFMNFEPERLFVPQHEKLDAIKWWELATVTEMVAKGPEKAN